MEILEYQLFMQALKEGKHIDETSFYFCDDQSREEHFLGFLPQYDKPCWIGYCDIPGGVEFQTAEELLQSPIFDHCSLKDRWQEVRFLQVGGIPLEEWILYFE